ncbi:hypothetical protein SFR_1943 [Streptomyces sp. FR-008]|nr:hypothetical protein SFR_1943 [Streptomyces sp. FR-008]
MCPPQWGESRKGLDQRSRGLDQRKVRPDRAWCAGVAACGHGRPPRRPELRCHGGRPCGKGQFRVSARPVSAAPRASP